MASPFFMKETGLRKEFGPVRPTERVANVIRIFWRQEFRQSIPFLTPAPLVAVVTVVRIAANLPWATIILPFTVEDGRFRPKEGG
jgi:hypothetical protein